MHDVLDPHDGGAARVDRADGPDQRVGFMLGQAAGDLVEQQQLGIERQRAGELEALALQQGQRPGRHVGAADELGQLQHLRRSARSCRARAGARRRSRRPAEFSNTVMLVKGCGIW